MNKLEIVLATDHAGFEYKEALKDRLLSRGYKVLDVGSHHFEEGDDYTDFMHQAGILISEKPDTRKAIVFGGSGQGEAMVMNRYSGVRCAVYCDSNPEIISLSRMHNDANALSIGSRFITKFQVFEAVDKWLEVDFKGGRHLVRIQNIEKVSVSEGNESIFANHRKIVKYFSGALVIFFAIIGIIQTFFSL